MEVPQSPLKVKSGRGAVLVCLAVNAGITALKAAAAFIFKSSALLSDAADSAADVFTSVVNLAAVAIASKSADEDHPYGHERYESLAGLLQVFLMVVSALKIAAGSVKSIMDMSFAARLSPITAAVAACSIAAKLFLSVFAARAGERFNSPSLSDSARNYRTDTLSSTLALVGTVGSSLGIGVLDPIAGIVICIAVFKTAFEILQTEVNGLVDRACDPETEQEIMDTVLAQDGVMGIDSLMTRRFANKVYVELEIAVAADMQLSDAHTIAHNVHDVVEKLIPETKHCSVHINPYGVGRQG